MPKGKTNKYAIFDLSREKTRLPKGVRKAVRRGIISRDAAYENEIVKARQRAIKASQEPFPSFEEIVMKRLSRIKRPAVKRKAIKQMIKRWENRVKQCDEFEVEARENWEKGKGNLSSLDFCVHNAAKTRGEKYKLEQMLKKISPK